MNEKPKGEKVAEAAAWASGGITALFVLILSIASLNGGSAAAGIGSVIAGGIFVISVFFKVIYAAVRNYGKTPKDL
jgi:hypothetical protein